MRVAIPDSSQSVVDANQKTTVSWFTFFQDVWRAIRGGIGISIGGTLLSNSTPAPSVGAVETNLMTYTVPASMMSNNGDEIYIKAWGTLAPNSNTKNVKLYFGSQLIITSIYNSPSVTIWQIEANIIRKTLTTQEIIGQALSNTPSLQTVYSNTTPAPSVGAVETNLMTYTVPASMMSNNGDEIQIDAWGTFALNANNKTVKLYFGGQTIYTTNANNANGGTWRVGAVIIRKTSTTQEIVGQMLSNANSLQNDPQYPVFRTAGIQNLIASNIIRVTGQGAVNGDIVQSAMVIKFTPRSNPQYPLFKVAGTQDLSLPNIIRVTGQGSVNGDITQDAMLVKLTPYT